MAVLWTVLVFICQAALAVASFAQYTDFYELNRTCYQTWGLLEASLNLTKISRIDFIQGNQLEICDSSEGVCCNRMLEKNLSQLSLKQYKKSLLNKNLLPVRSSLINYAYNFDNLIKEILDMARIEFDHEFNKTYYSANSARHLQQFDQFFAGLKNYYSEYQVNLKDIIKKLFANVARMILSLSAPKIYNPRQIDDRCLDEFLLDSDIRMELEKKLECALESVRLFSAGLTRIRDVVIEIYAKLDSSKQCVRELTQTYSCSMCLRDEFMARKRTVRPCYRTCVDAYKSCVNFDLNKIDPTIEYKINFESTMSTLKYEILDIIFNYRVNSDLILSKLKNKCLIGFNPSGSRASVSEAGRRQRRHVADSSKESLKIKLHLFFIDLNSYLYNLTYFWNQLVPNACKTNTLGSSSDFCWNGFQIVNKNGSKTGNLADKLWKTQASNESQALNRTFWNQIQILKLYNLKMSRQVEKIDSNEKLFSAKSNFRMLVDSISFYNSNKDTSRATDHDLNSDTDEYEDENYDYYDDSAYRNKVMNLKEFVPKSKHETEDESGDYYEDEVDEEEPPANHMNPDYDDYNRYDDESDYQNDYYDSKNDYSIRHGKNRTQIFPRIAQKVREFYYGSNQQPKLTLNSNLFIAINLFFFKLLRF